MEPHIVDNVVQVQTDQMIADHIRDMMNSSLKDVMSAMDYALSRGFIANFHLCIGPNGRNHIQSLTIVKEF